MEGIFFSTTMMRQETNAQIINTAKPGQFDLGNNVANDILIFARQTCNLSGFPRSVLAGTSNTVAQSSRLRCHSDQSNLDSNSSYHGLDFLADICMIKHNLVPSSASSLSSACTSPLPPMRNTVALAAPESSRTSSRGPEKSDDEHLKCLKLTVPPSSGNTRKDVDNARWVSRFNELVGKSIAAFVGFLDGLRFAECLSHHYLRSSILLTLHTSKHLQTITVCTNTPMYLSVIMPIPNLEAGSKSNVISRRSASLHLLRKLHSIPSASVGYWRKRDFPKWTERVFTTMKTCGSFDLTN